MKKLYDHYLLGESAFVYYILPNEMVAVVLRIMNLTK